MKTELTDSERDELARRREEYNQHPERFLVLEEDKLDDFFAGVRKDVQQRVRDYKAMR